MKVSIVFKDKSMVVDDKGFVNITLTGADPNWISLQWDSVLSFGWIDLYAGERITFKDDKLVKPFIDQYQAEKVKVDAIIAAQKAAAAAKAAEIAAAEAAAATLKAKIKSKNLSNSEIAEALAYILARLER